MNLKIQLNQLQNSLQQLGIFCDTLQKLAQSLPDNPYGEIPNFDWLEQGFLFRQFALSNPPVYQEFLDENSEILSRFDVKKYLGSGAIGDAWLLEDGKVLKIYDGNATIGSRTEKIKYNWLMGDLFGGNAPAAAPMIYETGEFKIPVLMPYAKVPNADPRRKFNHTGVYKPEYVILEFVKSFDSVVQEYADQNQSRIEPQVTYNYEGDIEDFEDPDYIPVNPAEGRWEFEYDHADYRDFLEKFIHYMMSAVIGEIKMRYENFLESEYEDEDNDDDDEYMIFSRMVNPQFRKNLAKDLARDIEASPLYSESDMIKFEEMLGLESGWEQQLAEAIVENIHAKRFDLHSGNLGFRGKRPIFFDA